jgi:hypothetical protein
MKRRNQGNLGSYTCGCGRQGSRKRSRCSSAAAAADAQHVRLVPALADHLRAGWRGATAGVGTMRAAAGMRMMMAVAGMRTMRVAARVGAAAGWGR